MVPIVSRMIVPIATKSQPAAFMRALLLHQPRQRHAHLVEVAGAARELELVEGLVHLAGRRHRVEVDDVLLELHRHRGGVGGGADVRDHREDLVLVHELLRRQHRLLRVVARVLEQQLDLAAVHAALLVELVGAQHHAEADLLAEAGDRAGEILDRAEHDLVLADALRLGEGGGRQRERGGECKAFHGLSPGFINDRELRSVRRISSRPACA
jgi:hypothetical protein